MEPTTIDARATLGIEAARLNIRPGESAMRDELTCWDYVHEFTGQQAALAIVGEPLSDDPKTLAKTLPVLERMRQSYEDTLQWFTAGPDHWEIAPAKHVLMEHNPQSPLPPPIAPQQEASITATTSDTERVEIRRNWLECERSNLPCLPQILKISNPQNPLPSIELQQAISSIDAATSDVARTIIFHRRMERLCADESDFDRQHFSRTVLARWVNKVGATSLYPFTRCNEVAAAEVEATSTISNLENGLEMQAKVEAIPAGVVGSVKSHPCSESPPLITETAQARRARWLASFELEEKRQKRGALQRLSDKEGVDRSNMSKGIKRARAERNQEIPASTWASHLVRNGRRTG